MIDDGVDRTQLSGPRAPRADRGAQGERLRMREWSAAAVTPASDLKPVKSLLAAQTLQTDWLR
jgi:hypothetical protein